MNYQQPGVRYCGEKPPNRLGIASLVLAIVALGAARVPLCGPIAMVGLGVIGGVLGLVGLIIALFGLRSSVGFPIAGIVTCAHATIIGLVFILGAPASDASRPSAVATARPLAESWATTERTPDPSQGVREAEARQVRSVRATEFEPMQWRGVRAQLLRPVLPAGPLPLGR